MIMAGPALGLPSGQMARGKPSGLHLAPLRFHGLTLRHRAWTARMEAAPRGRIRGIRYFALQDDPLSMRRRVQWERRGEQRFRVWMERLGVHRLARAGLDEL